MSRRFGRYLIRDELTEELGRGAFGRVYRAFDPNINRYVAIKVLSSGSDPDMLVRFQDESKTAGKLEHENIVKVYDFDLQDGMPYLVMELLDGETLETIIKTQKMAGLPIQLLDKVEIMFQVGKGLQYAHAENVVHRDIKPGNIMVLPNGTVKVMDFGIARVMDKDGTRRTRQGDIAGTVLYMAPEQFGGRDADKRTDIFAYADVYYELLTGQHPFFGSDFATVMYRITTHDPRPIREMVPECPVALESMIQRMLVKDPEIRPDRLDEVLLKTQPILQRLRRERAAVVAAEIETLIRKGAREKAEQVIAEVLQLDPLNQEAEHWQGQIQQERDYKARHARAEALVRQGQEQLSARRFKEALQSYESALKLDPADPEIRNVVDQVRLTVESVKGAERLLTEARTDMDRGQLEPALDKAARAAELDPGNAHAPHLRDQLRHQIRSRQEAALLARAESLATSGDYDGAAAVLNEAESAGLGGPKTTACRARVERERAVAEKRRRQAAFAAALAKAREALYSQRLQEAGDTAEALCAEYPEEPTSFEFRSEVQEYLAAQRRLEGINRATQTARTLIKEKRLDDAREVLESGLRAYPRDTGISRLMEIVSTLAAAQERARRIGQVVRQSHSLADEGRLDEALQMVTDTIAEFGEETSLIECKRNYQLERDQREYARGLQSRLEQGRRLIAESNPAGAVGLLEDAMTQYPGEPEVALLLSSARSALAAFREAEFVKQHRSQIAALESAEQYTAALGLMEAALTRYPGNAELQDTARRLHQKLQEQERKRQLTVHIRRVEEAIQSRDWDSAAAQCEIARLEFPNEAALNAFAEKIQEAHRQQEIAELQAHVRGCLSRQDLQAAERQLEATRPTFSEDLAWQALWQEFERYRAYDQDVKLAEEARAGGTYDRAEELLRRWLAEAPDGRAAKLLEAVSRQQREAAEQARREAAQRQREEAVAKGRSEAEALVRQGNYQGALAILDQLAGRYPDRQDVQRDLEAAAQSLQRQRAQQEEAAIAKGLNDADGFTRQGDYARAIAILDQLAGRYPDRQDIQHDRELVADALARQRREAEEMKRRQEADAAISKGRREAEALAQKGDYARAAAVLDQLDSQYPGRPEILRDREAAAEALERLARQEQEDAAVAKGLRDAETFVQQSDYARALAILDPLASQYPERPQVARDREAAAQALERQQRLQREEADIAKARSDAEASVRQADYPRAIQILDQLIRQYPNRTDIQKDREAAAKALDRRQRQQQEDADCAKARSDAQAAVQQGDYPHAVEILDQAIRQCPKRSDIQADREAAVKALDSRQKQQKEDADCAKGRSDAQAAVEQGDYAGAIRILYQLIRQYPNRSDIRKDREAAAKALAGQQRQQQEEADIAKGRSDAQGLVRKHDFQGAVALLERLAKQYPGHQEVALDHENAQRELELARVSDEIADGRHDAAALAETGDYTAAIARLQELVRKYPDRAAICQDLDALKLARDKQQQKAEEEARTLRVAEAIAQGRREAASLSARSAHADAIELLDRLEREYGSHPGIQQDRQAANAAWDRLRQQTAISEERRNAAALVAQGDHRGALAFLERLASAYPGNPDILGDREAVQREIERQDREAEERDRRQREEAAIDKARSDAAGMIRNGDHQAAMAMLDWFAAQYPEHAGIQQDREELAQQLRRLREEADERARRELEQLTITQGRQDATALIERGEQQQALALLDRLAGQYPDDSAVRADRDAAAEAWEQRRQEIEGRAQRALSAHSSARQRDVAATVGGAGSQPVSDDPAQAGQPELSREEAAEQRAKAALAALSARKKSSPNLSDTSSQMSGTQSALGRLASKLREKLSNDG